MLFTNYFIAATWLLLWGSINSSSPVDVLHFLDKLSKLKSWATLDV